jgi:glucosamine--fructose-6-phosphate aminotransferase (isomerizing)
MTTQMEIEARETPTIITSQIKENGHAFKELCARLNKSKPAFALTIARGSSDHACTFAKYLFETYFNLVTASAAPSVLTLYKANLNVKNAFVLGISQSGKSPDICELMQSSRKNGAITCAIVNDISSPLAKEAEFVLPMMAGVEQAVAATKSYIASLAILIQLVAHWSKKNDLQKAIPLLPERLTDSLNLDWSAAVPILQPINDTLVLGRGFGFPIALEAALKFKETAVLHAEAFSGAEVLHGPFALIKKSHPYLLFTQQDEALPSMLNLAQKIKNLGGVPLIAATPNSHFSDELHNAAFLILPLPKSLHPICDPLMAIQAFYLMIAKLALARGFNPDQPSNLQKITETV